VRAFVQQICMCLCTYKMCNLYVGIYIHKYARVCGVHSCYHDAIMCFCVLLITALMVGSYRTNNPSPHTRAHTHPTHTRTHTYASRTYTHTHTHTHTHVDTWTWTQTHTLTLHGHRDRQNTRRRHTHLRVRDRGIAY